MVSCALPGALAVALGGGLAADPFIGNGDTDGAGGTFCLWSSPPMAPCEKSTATALRYIMMCVLGACAVEGAE